MFGIVTLVIVISYFFIKILFDLDKDYNSKREDNTPIYIDHKGVTRMKSSNRIVYYRYGSYYYKNGGKAYDPISIDLQHQLEEIQKETDALIEEAKKNNKTFIEYKPKKWIERKEYSDYPWDSKRNYYLIKDLYKQIYVNKNKLYDTVYFKHRLDFYVDIGNNKIDDVKQEIATRKHLTVGIVEYLLKYKKEDEYTWYDFCQEFEQYHFNNEGAYKRFISEFGEYKNKFVSCSEYEYDEENEVITVKLHLYDGNIITDVFNVVERR